MKINLLIFFALVSISFAKPPYKYLIIKKADILALSPADQAYPFKNYGSPNDLLVADSMDTALHSVDGLWIYARYTADHSGIKQWFMSKSVEFTDYNRNQIEAILATAAWPHYME